VSEVKVREGETFESALRRFNKKIKQNGILLGGSQARALREAVRPPQAQAGGGQEASPQGRVRTR